MSEIQNIPEESLPGNEPDPIPQTDYLTNQSPQLMEVHTHGHVHEKKKWKEYVFQFLMLFLAVSLSFLAENLREHFVEKNIEKEYIESLVTDLSNDNDLATRNSASIFEQVKEIDTLQKLFFSVIENGAKKDSIIAECYIRSVHLNTFYSEFFNERTITQLLSSGNMRLIRKEGVPDEIMDYHSFIKFVEGQKQLYVTSINRCVESMYNVYDISFLKTNMLEDNQFHYDASNPDKFLTTDPNDLKKFIAILESTKIVAFSYKKYLVDMMDKSKKLYYYLRQEYNITR
jgi:hypothetical protein